MNVLILFALSRWTSVSFEFWTYDSYHKYVDSARRSASILVNCNKLKTNTIVLQSNGGHVCAPPLINLILGMLTWREEDRRRQIILAPYFFCFQFTCKGMYWIFIAEW